MATSVRLPEATEKRLNELAAKTGRTKAYYIREAIEAYIEDMENVYLAEKAYETFVKSGKDAIPLEKVMRELDLAD